MKRPEIIVCDQTIREGMQYRGIVFTLKERLEILSFQESLGVDISQVAYPPAHESEKISLCNLKKEAEKKKFTVRIAGLGRSLETDVDQIAETGTNEIQMHTILNKDIPEQQDVGDMLAPLVRVIHYARAKVKNATIAVSILDIGKTDQELLRECAKILAWDVNVDLLTLPDTSGIVAPNLLYKKIQAVASIVKGSGTRIGVHCHNDMGMATANTVIGVSAGASLVEVTALGIGERNGIGDLFLVGRTLKEQGYEIHLEIDKVDEFKEYYNYVDMLIQEKTGSGILNYNTPFFGNSMMTHVAGTHGSVSYGLEQGNEWLLNVLCGKHLVKKFLEVNKIQFTEKMLSVIVEKIKNRSVKLGRSLDKSDVEEIIRSIHIDTVHLDSL